MIRVPDQLHYASLPGEDELVLVTSVLGASASWLVHAFLKEALTAADGRGVVFVSFTRDLGFHGECVRKLGIDLTAYAVKGRFAFVDGLSRLFPPYLAGSAACAAGCLSVGGGINGIVHGISQEIKRLSVGGGKPLLVLENPDFLSAALEGVGVGEMEDMVLGLREVGDNFINDVVGLEVLAGPEEEGFAQPTGGCAKLFLPQGLQLSHATIVMVNADSAFLHEPRTRLEIEHAAFVVSLSHNAAWTVGLRLLDTGVARDISGVIRITRGAEEAGVEEKEVLYYVGDGTVEVFDRGQIRG